MQSGNIDSNGQRLYYEVHGEGMPLVLIMGIGQDSSAWGPHQIPVFSSEFQVIAFDNRDAGRSSKATRPYSIADMADDVAGLLDGLAIDRVHLLGHSMGGMIAMEFALRYPERLDKLVLACTAAGTARAQFDPFTVWSFVKQHDAEGDMFAAMQFAWSFSVDFLRDHQAVEEALAQGRRNPYPMSQEAFERQAHAYLQHDALDRIGQIEANTLVLAAEQDRLTPPWIGREIAETIPSATFHLVEGPGSSHAVLVERPDDYNNVVLSFLKN